MRRSVLDNRSSDDEEGINLTPMLDVVFIMLIFFIVTASFVKEAGIDVSKPEAETAVPKKNANILVAISANNEIWIDRAKIDRQAIRARIERMHAENPEGSVLIQADKDSHSEALLAVMAAAREAKVNVSISANTD
jgi:biopolymer transport protein ExbD